MGKRKLLTAQEYERVSALYRKDLLLYYQLLSKVGEEIQKFAVDTPVEGKTTEQLYQLLTEKSPNFDKISLQFKQVNERMRKRFNQIRYYELNKA